MDEEIMIDKSCDPQHFSTGYPTSEWTVEELAVYAQAQHKAIGDDERRLASKYWRLGQALNLLRKNFDHGQWERLLAKLSIEKTKAARARAIARTFESEQDVSGMTVQEAYDKRVRQQRRSSAKQRARDKDDQQGRLSLFLNHVSKTAEPFIDAAAFAKSAEASALLPVVDEAITKLEQIRSLLCEQTGGGQS